MTPLARRVKRWWRSRGHGVHSPFAFRFITMVLRGRGVYYASAELEAMPDPAWHSLLFKLVCEFEPSQVTADLPFSAYEFKAIALADSRVTVVHRHRPSAKTDSTCAQMVSMNSPKGDVTIVRDITVAPTLWNGIIGGMDAGMTFTKGRFGIAVSRPDLPRQDYEIL